MVKSVLFLFSTITRKESKSPLRVNDSAKNRTGSERSASDTETCSTRKDLYEQKCKKGSNGAIKWHGITYLGW